MRVAFLTAKDSDLILVVSILVIKKSSKKDTYTDMKYFQ